MDVTKPYEFIGLGAMDVTKPYEFIGLGAMDVTKPYEFIGFEATGHSPNRASPKPGCAKTRLCLGTGCAGQARGPGHSLSSKGSRSGVLEAWGTKAFF